MRYSSFFQSKSKGLRGLGDVACERDLLKRLAAQFFYNLTGTEASAAGSLAAPFLYAYLGSTSYANNPVFPDGAGLLFLLQSYMAEFLGSSPDVDTLLAITTPTLENLTDWSGRVTIPAVPAMTRVQAEAAMLLCQTPAVDPAANAAASTATAERARRDAETARAAAATAAANATSPAAQAEAAVAAAAAAVAAQFAANAAAAANTAAAAAAAEPTSVAPSIYARPGSASWSILTPAQRAALLATRNEGGGGGGGGDSRTSSYLPYVVGGGLLLAAAVVFASKSGKKTTAQVSA